VHASPQLGFDLAQLRLQPPPNRLPHHREPSVPLLPADVREAEEVERLRLPLAGALPTLGREGPELQQPRLLGVQLQAELCEPLPQVGQEFRDLDAFKADMDDLLRALKDSPKADGQDRIYVAGEPEWECEQRRRREGIPVAPGLVSQLREVSVEVGVPFRLGA
jgi:hypothetical protein